MTRQFPRALEERPLRLNGATRTMIANSTPRPAGTNRASGLFPALHQDREVRRPYECKGHNATSIRVSGLSRSIEVKAASERDEYAQAFRMLASRYQARGYEEPSAKLFRFTAFHVLPETVTYIAKERDRVVATLSLVPDTRLLGLPMECIYGPEIAELRGQGRRMAEPTSLADEGLTAREFSRVFMTMITLMKQYHVSQGGDTWVITVNPRHRNYYVKVLGYRPLGPCRSYPSVCGHPAEAYLVDLPMMKMNAPGAYRTIFGQPLPPSVLTVPARPADHARYFGERSTQADRRTIMNLSMEVECLGSPPRWKEGATQGTLAGRYIRNREELGACGP
jgi:hypothetical protein